MKTPKILVPLLLIIFIDSFGYGLVIPVLLRILTESGQSYLSFSTSDSLRNVLFGLGVALSPCAYILAAPIMGMWSDRWGRKKTLLISLFASLLGFLLPILAVGLKSFILVLLGRFLTGAASSSQPIAQAAITDVSSGRQKAFYLSLVALAMTLAMVAGPALGAYLSDQHLIYWFDYRTPYYLAAFLVALNIVLVLFFYKTDSYQTLQNGSLTFKNSIRGLLRAFSDRRISLLLIIFFFYEYAWSLYFQDLSLFLTHKFHYTVEHAGLFMTYSGLWMSLGLLVIYPLLVRIFSLSHLLVFCLFIAFLGFVTCVFADTSQMQWLSVIPVAIAVGMAYPTLLTLLSEQVQMTEQGWVMGAGASMLGLSWMISALMAGTLSNISINLPFVIATITLFIAFISAILMLFVRKLRVNYVPSN